MSDSGLKTRSLWTLHIRHNVVSILVTVCPCQQFVLKNCHGTSAISLHRKTGEARDQPTTPGRQLQKRDGKKCRIPDSSELHQA